MATTVPYAPEPTVNPQDPAIPQKSLNTPIDAFGGATAAAIGHLGQVAEGAGKEIFARGLAMQELNQQARANEAVAGFTTKLGDLHAQYTSLEGKNAVDGLKPYQDSVNDLRTSMSESLPSAYAQRQFDQESRNIQARAMWAAGGHAGEQNKKYVVNSLNARQDTITNSALADPHDEIGFNSGLDHIRELNDQKAQLLGWSDAQKTDELQKATQGVYASRIQGMTKSEPFAAGKILDDAVAKGDLSGPDAARMQDFVKRQQWTVGSRQITNQIMSGDGNKFGESILPQTVARTGIKAVEGGNYGATGIDVPARGGHVAGNALGAYGIMSYNLSPWLKEAGMPDMSAAEFLKNPTAQDQLFDFKFGQLQKSNGSFNGAIGDWLGHGKGGDDLGTTIPGYQAKANAAIAKNSSLQDLTDRGRRVATESAPDDPLLADYTVNAIEANHSHEARIQADTERRQKDTVDSALMGNFSNGYVPANIDELKHTSPEVEAAVNALPAPAQITLQKNITSYNNAITKQTNDSTWHQALGLWSGTDAEKKEFMELNPYQMALSRGDMGKIVSMQRDLSKQWGGDPSVNTALQVIAPQLDAAGIGNKSDPEVMRQFRGSFIQAYYDMKEQTGGKISLDDTKKIASTLLSQHNSPNFWFHSSTDALFKLPLPSEKEQELRERFPNISEGELESYRQEYVRQNFNALQKQQSQASK
jgi:hypothetical protein